MNFYNPFARRETRSRRELAAFRLLALASWALAVAVSVYFAVRAPPRSWGHHAHRIADQNRRHPTAFSLHMVVVYVYWIALFLGQAVYLVLLGTTVPADADHGRIVAATAAAAVGSHFVANNLLHTLYVLLFAGGWFFLAELVLLVNFLNLTSASLRHAPPRPASRLAALDSNSAAGATTTSGNGAHRTRLLVLPGRLVANIFVWALPAYGLFYLGVYGDYTIGAWLTLLAAALGAGQLTRQVIALQWIFAFVATGLLAVATLATEPTCTQAGLTSQSDCAAPI
ncbi:histone deacetylase [Niveomyces insectorum RCEF 264]|uniref:Histone deacetylase n=1 Tax=Niveomyces insectorum RCEF 264 TaxID=1081102 RepID=A0A167PU54_9HYPO|nr:histone deacetylase [Niveomyces insectorum RCEF 264]